VIDHTVGTLSQEFFGHTTGFNSTPALAAGQRGQTDGHRVENYSPIVQRSPRRRRTRWSIESQRNQGAPPQNIDTRRLLIAFVVAGVGGFPVLSRAGAVFVHSAASASSAITLMSTCYRSLN